MFIAGLDGSAGFTISSTGAVTSASGDEITLTPEKVREIAAALRRASAEFGNAGFSNHTVSGAAFGGASLSGRLAALHDKIYRDNLRANDDTVARLEGFADALLRTIEDIEMTDEDQAVDQTRVQHQLLDGAGGPAVQRDDDTSYQDVAGEPAPTSDGVHA